MPALSAPAGPSGPLWRLDQVQALVGVTVLGFLGLFLTLATLPTWAVAGGASDGYAGLIITVLLATTVATQTLVSSMIGAWGELPTLALGLLALGLPAPFYLLDQSFGWLLALSVVRGAGFGIVAVLGSLLAARLAPPGRMGEALGLYGLSIASANLLAVPVSVALTSAGHFPVVAVLAGCPLLALVLLRPIRRHLAPPPDPAARAPGDRRRAVRLSAVPAVLLGVVTLAGGGLTTYLPIERPHGADAALVLLVFGVTGGFTRWRSGVFADRIGLRRVLPAGLGAAAAGLLALALAVRTGFGPDSFAVMLVAAGVFGVGFGVVQNLTLLMTFDRVGASGSAIGSAVWNGAFDAGTSIGAFVVGALAAGGLGFGWTLALCAGLIAVVIPLTLPLGGRAGS